VYTWEQGRDLPVFVNGELVLWKQELIEIVHNRPIVKTPKPKKIYKDPFEHYTENELDALLESMTGYQMFKEFFQIDRIKRIVFNLIEQYRIRCSKSSI